MGAPALSVDAGDPARGAAMADAPQYILVKVKPNSRSAVLRQHDDGHWTAELKAAPADGRANAELVRLVARHFGCPATAVSIRTGASARTKLVRIGVDQSDTRSERRRLR